jgi:hypothetical protein
VAAAFKASTNVSSKLRTIFDFMIFFNFQRLRVLESTFSNSEPRDAAPRWRCRRPKRRRASDSKESTVRPSKFKSSLDVSSR